MTHNSPVQEIWFHAHAHHSTLIKETLHEKKSKIFQKRTNKQTVQLVFLSNVIYWSCSIYIWFRIHCILSMFYKYRHFSSFNGEQNSKFCPVSSSPNKGRFWCEILSNLNLFKKKFDGFGLFWEGVLITLTFLFHWNLITFDYIEEPAFRRATSNVAISC